MDYYDNKIEYYEYQLDCLDYDNRSDRQRIAVYEQRLEYWYKERERVRSVQHER